MAVVISISLLSFMAYGKTDPYSVPPTTAIENKMYEPSKELNFQIGLLPLDAFYKALLLNVGYTNYYQSFWGWEVFNASMAFTQDTGLRNDLRENFGVKEATYLDYINYTVTTNLVYTPVYNKNLLFNKNLVHGEISFLGGGGMASFKSGKSAPMAGGGLIFRFFLSDRWSWKFDNRVYYHFAPGMSTNYVLSINLGLSYEFDPSGKEEQRSGRK
jgi:outer membrane beta-barrel protein